ncbi:hypothetical protein NLI96_g3604 [Meripilus lineatus]|uniref:Uncharacterized protein n=1 Tax=Meripilus lineatus TaxID=2056292 RepID=A0AAD5YGF9_9APHY|nr:hypothetical protein NLI96_g3604 [Physisporinus lineatus]
MYSNSTKFVPHYGEIDVQKFHCHKLIGGNPVHDSSKLCVQLCSPTQVGRFTEISAIAFMVLRHYALWDGNKKALFALVAVFIVTYGTTIALAGVTVKSFYHHMSYSPVVRMCVIDYKPPTFLGVWCGTVAFDLFTIFLTIGNALDRPHRQSVRLIAELNRDGAFFFFTLFCEEYYSCVGLAALSHRKTIRTGLRLLNLLLSVILGAQDMFLIVFFVWAMISITMSRLVLRVEILKAKAGVPPWSMSNHLNDDEWPLMPIHVKSAELETATGPLLSPR